MALQDDGKCQSMLGNFGLVGLTVAPAYYENLKIEGFAMQDAARQRKINRTEEHVPTDFLHLSTQLTVISAITDLLSFWRVG